MVEKFDLEVQLKEKENFIHHMKDRVGDDLLSPTSTHVGHPHRHASKIISSSLEPIEWFDHVRRQSTEIYLGRITASSLGTKWPEDKINGSGGRIATVQRAVSEEEQLEKKRATRSLSRRIL